MALHLWKTITLVAILAAGIALPAAAQPTAVDLTVLDGGAPLAGARISATSAGGTLLATGVTDEAGRVVFRLPHGARVRLRVAAAAGLVEAGAVVGRDLPCVGPGAGKGRGRRCAGRIEVEGLAARVAPAD